MDSMRLWGSGPDVSEHYGTRPGARCRVGRPVRFLLLCLGWLSVACGIVGAFLPLMPTTIFLLIALWCFVRSSPRLAAWLYGHARLGPVLHRWHVERIVPLEAKVAVVMSMSASLLILHGFVADMVVVKWGATAVCLTVLIFLLSRPHASRSDITETTGAAVDGAASS